MAVPEPVPEHHHRNVQGGAARAAVFGVSDGLVSNVGLVLGVAGSSAAPSFVRLAGLISLVSGAFSMAAGEYLSMTAQTELLERELEMERTEIRRNPQSERQELAAIYSSRGLDPAMAEQLATEMMRDPELALEAHAREELGIDPGQLGSPMGAAASSFFAFALGAVIPLLPWFLAQGAAATVASVVVGVMAAVAIGVALGVVTARSPLRPAVRQLVVAGAAAAVGYVLGSLMGGTTPT
ncbi:MAG: VIT1/CCC1 transporter family protein [Actinomycetota bacterium]|nr:VIT1/CCC1 transporter family protein [Actinomycetota bacterium]MDQ3679349.1 VIT1/CCC1 transporter family protein [Actinomycetota bacterium]